MFHAAMLLFMTLFMLAYGRPALANADTARSLCDEYTSKSRRPNGQHCYLFTDTVLVCGVENRQDGLYQMKTGSNHESWIAVQGKEIYDVMGSPEEVQCSSILAYLDRQGGSREMHVGQQEL